MRQIAALLIPFALLAAGCRSGKGRGADGPIILVSATYRGANASTVADAIAAPIEQEINGAEGSVRIESECRDDGTYSAAVRFGAGTEPQVALVLVQNRVALATPLLPDVVKREGVSVKAATPQDEREPTVRLALLDRGERGGLRPWAEAVQKRLADDGVLDDVVLFPGPDEKRFEAKIDPRRCSDLGVAVADVQDVIKRAGKLPDPQAVRQMQVRSSEGKIVSLGTVASFALTEGPPAVCRVDLYRAVRISGVPAKGKPARAAARCREIAEEERKRLKLADDFAVVILMGE
jgi:multidrug efflux pump subunit AcrB